MKMIMKMITTMTMKKQLRKIMTTKKQLVDMRDMTTVNSMFTFGLIQ